MSNFSVEPILEVTHGSLAYGTNVEGSDVDIKGVCIEPIKHQIGFLHHFEQLEELVSKGHPYDRTIYSLKKFAALAAECNPNIIEVLHVDVRDIQMIDTLGWELREARGLFVSKQARFKFSGYAHAQLKRIKTHRSWLLSPPTGAPERSSFGLGDVTKVSKSELGAFDSMVRDGVEIELPKDVLSLFVRERQYLNAKNTWEQYCNWKQNRNPARAVQEAISGYCTKHGMHLIRLMRMCREILAGDGVIVRRPDAVELLEIRSGRWSYDRLISESEALEAECARLYLTSSLPREADRKALNALVVDLTERRYGRM